MRCWQVVALALVAGCGRYHFNEAAGDGGGDSIGSGPFGAPVLIPELVDTLETSNPAVRPDELEMFLVRRVDGMSEGNVYVTHRTSTELPWGPTTLVPELNSGSDEAGLHLSSDGLTLWFASARPGGAGMHDIYRTTRPSLTSPFDPPARVIELCSTMPEHNASVDDGELTVVMSRGLMPRELYGSQRPDRASAWRPPVVIPEISSASDDEANPSLSPDGLTVYFATDRQSGNKDLWTTTRPTISDPFAAPVPVDGVNSTAGEYQAWVSADAHVIYFSSDRSGTTSIYRATR